jgi:hypothetical protein
MTIEYSTLYSTLYGTLYGVPALLTVRHFVELEAIACRFGALSVEALKPVGDDVVVVEV